MHLQIYTLIFISPNFFGKKRCSFVYLPTPIGDFHQNQGYLRFHVSCFHGSWFKVQEPRRGDITKDRVSTLSERRPHHPKALKVRHNIRYCAPTGRWVGCLQEIGLLPYPTIFRPFRAIKMVNSQWSMVNNQGLRFMVRV